jgi:hypothetical protein
MYGHRVRASIGVVGRCIDTDAPGQWQARTHGNDGIHISDFK